MITLAHWIEATRIHTNCSCSSTKISIGKRSENKQNIERCKKIRVCGEKAP